MPLRTPRAFGLRIDPDRVLPEARYPFGAGALEADEGGSDGGARRVEALARALASSPVWREMEEGILVVRTTPPAGLAFLGNFSDAEVERLRWLPTQLDDQLPFFRYVSWQQAEADVEALAERLRARWGSDEIRRMHFVGIPRGGVIVLGMLAYALDLPPDCLMPEPDSGRPLVVVDDCALSGRRFSEFLCSRAGVADELVFAHLYSAPGLRHAVEEREARVVATLAARDLQDLSLEIHGDDIAGWRARWKELDGEEAYVVGRFEHVAFPWAEPDLAVWDPALKQPIAGWRLVPPEACLKNRGVGYSGSAGLEIQASETGAIQLAPGVYHGEVGDQTLVADIDSGQVVALKAVAQDMWREFLECGTVESALERLQEAYRVPADALRRDAIRFLQELRSRGILVKMPGFGPSIQGDA